MDKIEILTNLPVSPSSYWALIFATICVLSIVSFSNPKRQTIFQSVPVVGVDRTKGIRQAREEFRHGSKNILLEGYRKVYLLLFILTPARSSQHKGKPFYVPTKAGERLMIPAKYVEELKNTPASQTDFPATYIEVGLAFERKLCAIIFIWFVDVRRANHYRRDRTDSPPRIIRVELNRYLCKPDTEI